MPQEKLTEISQWCKYIHRKSKHVHVNVNSQTIHGATCQELIAYSDVDG